MATILNVDDDEAGRYAITRLLRQAGYTVLEAGTGGEALQLAADTALDLVLLDVNLPDMLGFEVARRLKSDQATATLPIMHVSATSVETHSVVTGLDTGADMYLVQPVDPQVLLASVRAMLRVRVAEQAREEALRTVAAAERRLRVIVENTETHLAYLDQELTLVLANRPFAARYGSSPQELVGRSSRDIFEEDIDELLREALTTRRPVARDERPARAESDPEQVSYWSWQVAPVLGEGAPVEGLVLSITDVTESVRARERSVAEAQARADLAETMAREMSHRIKNNLAMLAGLLQYQTAQEQDERISDALREATSRLLAIAHVHEQMQQGAGGGVDLLDATRHIADAVAGTFGTQRVAISVEGEAVYTDAKTAASLAVIINELITNALKHGAPGEDGILAVAVAVRVVDDNLHLSVWNSGNPVRVPFRYREQSGMGLQLVRALVLDQQGGSFLLTPERGGSKARINLRLPRFGAETRSDRRARLDHAAGA